MKEKIFIALTFDVEMTQRFHQELTEIIPNIAFFLAKETIQKATWMVRADRDIQKRFGAMDWVFQNHGKLLEKLVAQGHEIGWHPHCSYGYQLDDPGTLSNVLKDLEESWSTLNKANIRTVRMGWGIMHNRIMETLDRLGLTVDSSSIPRPAYSWDKWNGLWQDGLPTPYHPSPKNYKKTCNHHLGILEIPLSVTHVPASYDSMKVMRYLNLAFKPGNLFQPIKKWIADNNYLVTITHPHELDDIKFAGAKHDLLSYSMDSFRENIRNIIQFCEIAGKEPVFFTLNEIGENFSFPGSASMALS